MSQEGKPSKNRPVFVIHYDPRLPSIPTIVQKHWRTMIQDPRLKEVFPAPPLVAYKSSKNIREILIRSNVPTIQSGRPKKRELPGMKTFVNTNNHSKSTGVHFNLKGHSVRDMEITIIKKVFNKDPRFRKQREKLFIQKFNTKYRGLNRLNGG